MFSINKLIFVIKNAFMAQAIKAITYFTERSKFQPVNK